jgi:hypothetical protein
MFSFINYLRNIIHLSKFITLNKVQFQWSSQTGLSDFSIKLTVLMEVFEIASRLYRKHQKQFNYVSHTSL